MLMELDLDLIEALLDNPLFASSIATARYSSTRGFSGGLTAGSTFVLLPMPNNPVVVTVAAIGLYWAASLLSVLVRSLESRAESGRGEY